MERNHIAQLPGGHYLPGNRRYSLAALYWRRNRGEWRTAMNRRTAVTFMAAAAGMGTGILGKTDSAAAAAQTPLAHSHRASFIERTDGTALFYRDWGTGKPIVFVASAGLPSGMWSYQMVPLVQAGFRCVAFDRRGHGRSSDPGRGYDFDTLADDLAAVMDVLDLRNVTLVGHSMGCAEIARYLTRHGSGRVARVALLAPTLPFLLKTADNPDGVDKAYFQALRATWMRNYPQWLAENARPFVMPDTPAASIQWCMEMMLQTSLQAAIECNVAVTETDFRGELPRIDKPVLILHGTADVSAPIEITGRPTAQLIKGSELKIYEGAPHGLFMTHLEQVNGELLRFVRA
jgi:non-heme chloroperoxidase